MNKNIYINFSTKDVMRARKFYEAVGLQPAPQFSNDHAVSFMISERAFLMVLNEEMFRNFTKKDVPNTLTSCEAILCLAADSKEEVDVIVEKALAAGGTPSNPKLEQPGMYGWSFQDPDGHLWEVVYMESVR